jgi:acyl-CoA hydrolase
MKARKASETLAITTKVVLPNDTNTLGNLFGGQLLAWMDVIASVSAHRHCRRVVVTASVNNVSFNAPIPHSSIVTLEAKVSRAFNSSMEVFVDVFVENPVTGVRFKANEAIYTFVAVDQMADQFKCLSCLLKQKKKNNVLREPCVENNWRLSWPEK